MLPQKRFKSESDSDDEEYNDDDEDDERYNQEMFRKRKAELEKAAHQPLTHILQRRKSSSGGEDSSSEEEEEEDERADMGLFGSRLQQFKMYQAERKHSPHKEEPNKRSSPTVKSPSNNASCAPKI